jgi:hypothetical protein
MRYREILGEDVQKVPDQEDEDNGNNRYDPSKDSFSRQELDDTRKPKLTLKQINRLKKIRSTKNLEMAKKQELLGIMYGQGSGGDDEI